MEQRDQCRNVVRAAAFATDADDRRLPICDPPRTHPFMKSSLQPFGPRLLGQAFWPPLGPSLSGPTPIVTGSRSGLQSRPSLPAHGSPLNTKLLFTCHTQQLFLILSPQTPAPAALTRRPAIRANGPPPPTQTCSRNGRVSVHAPLRRRFWVRTLACQQRANSNRPRRSPATSLLNDQTAPIPLALQRV